MADMNVTVTAPTGPGKTATAELHSGAKRLVVEADREILRVLDANDQWHDYDYETIATVTYTISGETATVTIST